MTRAKSHAAVRWGAAFLLGLGFVLATVAPRVRVRSEVEFVAVQVSVPPRVRQPGPVRIRITARNTNEKHRRVFLHAVDVSDSLAAGEMTSGSPGERARYIPITRAWRLPFDRELAAGEQASIDLFVRNPRAGDYEGFVDVVLDGSTWVRSEARFKVQP